MKKTLYYVSELDLQSVDGEIQETTGYQFVRVYEICLDKLVKLFELEIDIKDDAEELILEHLNDIAEDDNEVVKENFEFINL